MIREACSGPSMSVPARSSKPFACRASRDNNSRCGPATAVSKVAQGHARSKRVIVSACVNSVKHVSSLPLIDVNKTNRGAAEEIGGAAKTFLGSKRGFNLPAPAPAAATAGASAKKLRKPRASTSFPTTLSNTSSSERYPQPAFASCSVNVDLPLPGGPTINMASSLSGITTPALCSSNTPNRLNAAQTAKDVTRASSASDGLAVITDTLTGLPASKRNHELSNRK